MHNLFQNPIFLYLIVSLIFAILCFCEADDLGWDPVLGLGLGLWLGPIAYVALLITRKRKSGKTTK
jgi:hypothetical protein